MAWFGKKLATAGLLMGVALWATASPVQAVSPPPFNFQVSFQVVGSPGTLTVIGDNSLLPIVGPPTNSGDLNPLPGAINFTGEVIGGYTISGGFALENAPGGLFSIVQTNQFQTSYTGPSGVVAGGAGSLEVMASAVDFTSPAGAGLLVSATESLTSLAGTVSSLTMGYANSSNMLFDQAGAIATPAFGVGPLTGVSSSGSQASATGSLTAPYSLTWLSYYAQTSGGTFTGFNGNVEVTVGVPEIDPGSMSSALTLLFGTVALLGGRRYRKV